MKDEIKEKLGLKMDLFFSLKCVISNPCKILRLYLLIYIYGAQGNNLGFDPMNLLKQRRR